MVQIEEIKTWNSLNAHTKLIRHVLPPLKQYSFCIEQSFGTTP